MGSEIRGSSGQLESVEGPGRGSGRCPGGQAEVGEDLRNDGGMFDACPEPVEGAAMIFKGPPHWGQFSRSISNTRFSNRAQLMRTGAAVGGRLGSVGGGIGVDRHAREARHREIASP